MYLELMATAPEFLSLKKKQKDNSIENDLKPQRTKFCKYVHLLPNTIPIQFISI